MSIWNRLSQVNISNKERFQALFSEIVNRIQNNEINLKPSEIENEDHYLVIEENRKDSYFVHIVPKEIYRLFNEMQESAPNEFLGFSVVAGRFNSKDVRVSCFGVQCNLLGKSLFKK